ncbi:MAG: hypothetical protein ACOC4M_02585 [Promethearchaeia archaeon]
MHRYYLIILNIINALIFLWIIVIFNSIFNFDQVITTAENELVFWDVLTALRNIFTYGSYLFLYIVGTFTALIISGVFSPFPLFQTNFMFNFIGFFFKYHLDSWFNFPGGESPSLANIPRLMAEEALLFTNDLYLLIFQILFVISLIYAIRAIFRNDPKYNFVAVGCLVLMIVIPLMIFGFREMMRLFTLKVPFLEELKNPVDPRLTEIPMDDFFGFMFSAVALFAIVSYTYLEMSFQINYTNIVTKPSLEREDRLEAQIDLLRQESTHITANVDKIREEAKKKKEELGIEEKESVRGFFTQKEERFSYVKEMIRRKKLEEEEKKLVSAASKTRRLGRYIDRLFREDPEAEDTITAKSSAPTPQTLASSTILNFAFRLTLLIFLSYIIIHPHWFFKNVFNLPPSIIESVSMYSPEVTITLMLPFVLLFPVISKAISYIKHRNLIIRLKQEGRIKEILASVGDYVKEMEESEEETDQEDEGEESEE